MSEQYLFYAFSLTLRSVFKLRNKMLAHNQAYYNTKVRVYCQTHEPFKRMGNSINCENFLLEESFLNSQKNKRFISNENKIILFFRLDLPLSHV